LARSREIAGLVGAAVVTTALLGVAQTRSGHAANLPSCPTLNGVALSQSQDVTTVPNEFVVCTGRVPSFDGTPLRVDVSLPTVGYAGPGAKKFGHYSPLMIFMSGWSNDVCQFESKTLNGSGVAGTKTAPVNGCHGDYIGNAGYHWNNAWFANQGYVTITYTPRGWYDSCGNDPAANYSNSQDAACTGHTFSDPNCASTNPANQESWVHLYDRRWEIRDAQFLAGLEFDNYVNPASGLGIGVHRIIASGDSGGGGPSWDLALSRDTVLEHCANSGTQIKMKWKSPSGVLLHLAAAIPMFTWTDLLDALLPNGTSSDQFGTAPPDGTHFGPLGVDKHSYVAGLYALGQANAQYAPSGSDPDINKWFADIEAGEPYIANSDFSIIVPEVAGLLRSPYYIPIPSTRPIPIYSIQGLTDPLFPSLQSETEMNQMKTQDPSYPVWAFLADVGHSYAQNPLGVWQAAHNASNKWLGFVLKAATPPDPTYTIATAECGSNTPQTLTGPDITSMQTQLDQFVSAASQPTVSSNGTTTEGGESDPIANSSWCNHQESTDPGQAVYNFAVPDDSTMIGGPVVNVTATVPPGTATAEVAMRLWDVTPGSTPNSGTQSLISRGIFRIDFGLTPPSTPTDVPISTELWPNAYHLLCGHTLKLELTQNDSPTFRVDNVASSLMMSNLTFNVAVTNVGSSCIS
jgi:X-Pro dipeptidyl-peptidase C-terminal non-catalytic domain